LEEALKHIDEEDATYEKKINEVRAEQEIRNK
jgi:hypothetical protein